MKATLLPLGFVVIHIVNSGFLFPILINFSTIFGKMVRCAIILALFYLGRTILPMAWRPSVSRNGTVIWFPQIVLLKRPIVVMLIFVISMHVDYRRLCSRLFLQYYERFSVNCVSPFQFILPVLKRFLLLVVSLGNSTP